MVSRGWWCGSVALLALLGVLQAASSLAAGKRNAVQQIPFGAESDPPLHGRFLHFTDMHPDIFYSPGSSINDACHKSDDFQRSPEAYKHKKGSKEKKDRVGHWGAAVSVCDSPKQLIEATLDWLSENWMAKSSLDEDNTGKGIDFIIWTGDTARHDIDATHPRNAKEIFDYQRWALDLVEERFPGVPIVPNLGNNDIIPHNIMFPGPNSMTKAYADIWEKHIPPSQQDTVREGGYFAKEVIEGDLAVLSLNTLYWFNNNAAVRGCKGRHDPGTLQLDWMEETLAKYRNQSMQVHLMGHVPPTSSSYFEHCYERYTDMVLRYQDTLVGQSFGHANVDAWYLQRIEPSKHDSLIDEDAEKLDSDDYLTFFVAPSVVPTYLPSVRVWTYNTSRTAIDGPPFSATPLEHVKKNKHVRLPRYTSPDSPSRRNTYLTPLGYSQWVLDLNKANRRYRKETEAGKAHAGLHYQLEYTTYQASTLWTQYLGSNEGNRDHVPVPKHLLDRELARLEVPAPKLTASSLKQGTKLTINLPKKVQHMTRYGLSSCTVDEMLDWAKRMVSCKSLLSSKKKKRYSREGYCRMKGGAGYQYRNSEIE